MPSETMEASLGAVLSLATPILLAEFGTVHQLAEHLLGHPVFTHEFPMLEKTLRAAVLAQHPQLAEVDASSVTPKNWQTFLSDQEAKFGKTLLISGGSGVREKGPVETLRDAGFNGDVIVAESP